MFDIGGVELIVIAAVAILVVGPRELPAMLRGIGKVVRQVREMTGSVQRQFNDALKEAELDDVKKTIDDVRSLNPATKIRQTIAKEMKPLTDVGDSVKSAVGQVSNQTSSKTGATAKPVAVEASGPVKKAATSKMVAKKSVAGKAATKTASKAAPTAAKAPVKTGAAAKTSRAKSSAKTTPAAAKARAPAKTGAASATPKSAAKTTPAATKAPTKAQAKARAPVKTGATQATAKSPAKTATKAPAKTTAKAAAAKSRPPAKTGAARATAKTAPVTTRTDNGG